MVFLNDIDNLIAALFYVPAGLALAAWALRVACSLSSVSPPSFLQAVLIVILICITNVGLIFFMQFTQVSPGLGSHLIAPLLATATMIALTVRTKPFSAAIVTISFASICGGMVYILSALNAMVIDKILMS